MKKSKIEKGASHIVYEIMMFNGTAIKLSSGITDQFEINIALESFVVHSRNLFDFFYSEKKYPDDISVYDYLKRKKDFNKEKSKKRNLENLTNKANKQVAHLTYSRNNYNKINKGWLINKIVDNMNITITAFLKNLNSEEKKWFKDLYKAYNIGSS